MRLEENATRVWLKWKRSFRRHRRRWKDIMKMEVAGGHYDVMDWDQLA
jgi:hypothetical protein